MSKKRKMMLDSQELPELEYANDRELDLIQSLGGFIADYIEKYETDRTELLAALFHMCFIIFAKQTPLDLYEQCAEIDLFCHYLKQRARETNELLN